MPEKRQARSSAKACETSSRVGTPRTSPTYRLRSAKAVADASEKRWRYCTSSTREVGVPVRASYASTRLRISATAMPPLLGTGIP